MKIKTQFITAMLLSAIVLVVISASAIVTNRQADRAGEQDRIAHDVAQGASELSYLANDYVIYRESQQLERWQARFASFSREVDSLQATDEELQALIRSIQENAQRLKDVFDSVVLLVGPPSQGPAAPIDPALLQASWGRMAVPTQDLISDVAQLSQLLGERVDHLQHINSIVVVALIGAFGAYFVVNYWLILRRTLASLARLQAGTAVIGSGDLDFRIEEEHEDEIGDLSQAFNRMAADLQRATAQISEERRRYQELFDFAPDGYVVTDRAGTIQAANQAMGEMLGVDAQDLPGQTLERFVAPGDAPAFAEFLDRLGTEAGAGPWRSEIRLQPGGAEAISTAIAATVAGPSMGEPEAIRWLVRDVTHEKQMQAALLHSEKLSAAGRLASSLAHEINNPLTAALGCADLAIEDLRLGRNPSRHLHVIANALEQAGGIVHKLREIQRPPSAEEKRPTDLNELVQDVLFLVRRQAKAAGVEISWQPEADLPRPSLSADGIRQVFLNLVMNAIEAMEEGGQLAVRIRYRPQATRIGVEFADDGPGIDPVVMEALFEPFNTAREGSAGLGLFVCQNIVQQHEGAIGVETAAGQGTTFTVWLPV